MADVVFFDLDGTLVDHRGAVLEAIGRIVQAAPKATAPPDELVTLWWTLEGRHMQEYLAGQCSFDEHRRRRLRSFLPMLGEPVPESPGLLDAWFGLRGGSDRILALLHSVPHVLRDEMLPGQRLTSGGIRRPSQQGGTACASAAPDAVLVCRG